MYDRNLSTNNDYYPYNQFCSVSVFRSSNELFGSGEQEQEDFSDGDDNKSDTLSLDDIYTNTNILISQNESIIVQIDNLNNNLVTLHNDIKIGIGFGFVLMVYIIIKCAFGIFNKVFSSEKW